MHLRPAIFLDRDGTLNRDVGFAHRIEDLEILHNVVAGLRQLQSLGFELFVTTNQSGIARGYFSEADMHAFNAALCQRLADDGISIAGIYYCPFHPTAGRGQYKVDSPLRKPKPGMIELAADQHQLDVRASFAIGDKKCDILAAQAAGCRSILVPADTVGSTQAARAARPDFVAADLLEAAEFVARASRAKTPPPLAPLAHLALQSSRTS